MATLEEMAPAVEIYSIDEAFMNLAGVSNCMTLETFGRMVRERVLRDTHLTVGLGIAPTKTPVKLANHAAKKWSKTDGVVDLSDVDRQRKLMAQIPVDDVWGIGRRIGKKLNLMGIETALELAESSAWVMRKHFNVVMERTIRELSGESCIALEEFAPTKQQIVCSRSFGSRITNYMDMRQAVCAYAERAAEKLREEKQYCRQTSVFLRTSPHAEKDGNRKQPHFIYRADKQPLFFAAIGKALCNEDHGHEGFVIVTADSNQGMVDIHDRRPLALCPDAVREWLSNETRSERAEEIIHHGVLPETAFAWHPVSRAVGNIRNHGENLIARIENPEI